MTDRVSAVLANVAACWGGPGLRWLVCIASLVALGSGCGGYGGQSASASVRSSASSGDSESGGAGAVVYAAAPASAQAEGQAREERLSPIELEGDLRELEGELDGVLAAIEPRCDRACDVTSAICELSARICEIAARHPSDAETGDRCASGSESCERARTRVGGLECACGTAP